MIDAVTSQIKSMLPARLIAKTTSAQSENHKFGAFAGVFAPTLLTILGAIMYLRTGWVVGNAGLGGAFAIILLANLITICTGLSVSSIATNIRVRAGGAFSIISQSLGLEVGGSASVLLYLAQAVSVALYVFAFAEGWLRIFPRHIESVVVFVTLGVIFAIAFVSADLASRTRYLIMAIVGLSLISILLGSFSIGDRPGFTRTPVLWGDFPVGDFWVVFAVFFPAVTGIMAGISMSGVLEDPRESIPKGTLGAIGLSLVIYLGLAYWLSRVATPVELVNNNSIVVDKAFWGPAILAGILAATFSAGLNSLVAAPHVMQALGEHGVLPFGAFFAKTTAAGEPRQALLVTGGIVLVTLVIGLVGGGLNAIAPLITMFFLIMYAMLNGVVLLEQTLGLISFRPLFRIPHFVPLVGLVGCLFVMFLVNPAFSLVAIAVTIGLYIFLLRRKLNAPWSDVRSGLFVMLAEWAAKQVSNMDASAERAWKPNLLVPVQSTNALTGSYRFLKTLTYPRGSIRTVGLYPHGDRRELEGLEDLAQAFAADGIFARTTLLETDDFSQGLQIGLEVLHGVFFRPNSLFMPLAPDTDESTLQTILERASANGVGAILYAKHPITGLGREQVVNVWIREQSPDWELGLQVKSNLDLALLLAYQIARNWCGRINLITVVAGEAERANGEAFLAQLVGLGRMPRSTQTFVAVSTFNDYLPQAPQADLNIFGLARKVNLGFIWQVLEATTASCIFVRDSGYESALA